MDHVKALYSSQVRDVKPELKGNLSLALVLYDHQEIDCSTHGNSSMMQLFRMPGKSILSPPTEIVPTESLPLLGLG